MNLTIPTAAFEHLSSAVMRDGHLYPDTVRRQDGITVYPDSDDAESIHWLSHFTLDNYGEWAGAAIVCPRAPALEQTLFRFDDIAAFIASGYRNPFREPGVPDWYFFWTGNHRLGELKTWARSVGIIPQKDLPKGNGGYGIDTGLRTGRAA